MKVLPVLLAGALGFGLVSPALAADVPPASPAKPDDAKCILVGLALSTSKDSDVQNTGELMTLYFLGRYDRGAGGDLEKTLRDDAPTVQAGMQTIGPICGDALNARLKSLSGIAEQLMTTPAPAPGAKP